MAVDPRQARFLTWASLRWIVRHRAWTPYHLQRYARFALFRLRHREVVTEGFVFLGRDVQIEVDPTRAQIVLGAWTHLGDGTRLRAHNGVLRLGEKVVLGSNNVINTHLDIEIGAATLISDWVYICDFDHVTDDLERPIKDQGLDCRPVRIGPWSWVGTKVSILRGARVGQGCVLGAHAVVRGEFGDNLVIAGAPAQVVRGRGPRDPEAHAERERYLAEVEADRRRASHSG